MVRIKVDEKDFMHLLNTEKPKQVFYSEWGFFGTVWTFWFFGEDGIRRRLRISCNYCFNRIKNSIEKKGIKVLNAELV